MRKQIFTSDFFIIPYIYLHSVKQIPEHLGIDKIPAPSSHLRFWCCRCRKVEHAASTFTFGNKISRERRMQYFPYTAFYQIELKIMLLENKINEFWILLCVSLYLRYDIQLFSSFHCFCNSQLQSSLPPSLPPCELPPYFYLRRFKN